MKATSTVARFINILLQNYCNYKSIRSGIACLIDYEFDAFGDPQIFLAVIILFFVQTLLHFIIMNARNLVCNSV